MDPPPPRPSPATTNKNKAKRSEEEDPFGFCEVCRLNHDQGRRHKYAASHARALSSLLSRFQKKIADVRSFLRNPSILRADHSHLDRLWCFFCAVDVIELDSSFACGDAIRHLASLEHLMSVEGFLRKHGGGMNRVDSFRVSDADFFKWEKGCKLLKNASSTSSEGDIGPLPLPSKDIQHKLSSKNMDSFDNHSIASFNSNAYHAVMPLQSLTNEVYSVYPRKINGDPGTSSIPYMATASSGGLPGNMGHQEMHTTGSSATTLTGKHPVQLGSNGKISLGRSLTNGMVDGIGSGGDCTKVLKFAQISSAAGGCQANIHTGALPPWLDASEEKEINRLNTGPYQNKPTISSAQTGKSRKLNPKRVGAAWAERRRIELEMEKRGERVPTTADPNWLPNFGRVWQAGTRKESRKEFEMEKPKILNDDNQPELSLKIQPYISKRMRTDSPIRDNSVSGSFEDISNTQ